MSNAERTIECPCCDAELSMRKGQCFKCSIWLPVGWDESVRLVHTVEGRQRTGRHLEKYEGQGLPRPTPGYSRNTIGAYLHQRETNMIAWTKRFLGGCKRPTVEAAEPWNGLSVVEVFGEYVSIARGFTYQDGFEIAAVRCIFTKAKRPVPDPRQSAPRPNPTFEAPEPIKAGPTKLPEWCALYWNYDKGFLKLLPPEIRQERRDICLTVARKEFPSINPETPLWHALMEAGKSELPGLYQRYDPERGAKFSTYAYYRVRGAMKNVLDRRVPVPSGAGDDLLNVEPEIEDYAPSKRDLRFYEKCMVQLAVENPTWAEIIHLRDNDGLTFRKVHHKLGISYRQAYYGYYRAWTRLLQIANESDYSPEFLDPEKALLYGTPEPGWEPDQGGDN